MDVPIRIMGIDPGLASTGYGVIDYKENSVKVIEGGVITTRSKDSLSKRLSSIYDSIKDVTLRLKPSDVAIEDIFSVFSHAKTAILMGHARGVAVVASSNSGALVYEYLPTNVKSTVTGFGRATKKQVQKAVETELGVPSGIANEHVADAFAVALCHAYRKGSMAEMVFNQ